MSKKLNSITIDTVTAIMEKEYAEHGRRKMLDRVKWKDWGLDIVHLVNALNERGFHCVLITGKPGSGK